MTSHIAKTGMDGGKAAHTGRDQQPFLGKPSSHNINGDHDSQVQVWPAVEHENSISAAKAILSGSKNPSIRQMSTLWSSRLRGPHSWWVQCASLQSNVHCPSRSGTAFGLEVKCKG